MIAGYGGYMAIVGKEEYRIVPSRIGSQVLVFRGYAYGIKQSGLNVLRCTSHCRRKCLARAKINEDGSLLLKNDHNHPPTYPGSITY